jgi:DNA-binding MarR family transcriptional regulator
MDQGRQDPKNTFAHTLAGTLRVQIAALSRRLREQAHVGDLTGSQKSVLLRLERDGPSTLSALARAECVKPQSMGATVSTLEGAGLVIGSPDPADRRQTILALTPTCREMIAASRAAREDWLFRAIQAKLSPDEQQQLASALVLLSRINDQ